MTSWIEVDLNAIAHNLRVVKRAIDPETKIIGVVKGNAYGHGLVETARAVWTAGADILATASLDEAIALRVGKIRSPIIILGYIDPSDFRKLLDFDLTATIFDFEMAVKLAREAAKLNKWARVDIKVDTGMNRYGFPAHEALEQYRKILALEHLKIEGLHSHFADASDKKFSAHQVLELQNLLFSFQQNHLTAPMVHLAATEGMFRYPEAHFDAVRIGLALYGYYGFASNMNDLQPVLELKTRIAHLKTVEKGETIGYRRTFVAQKAMKIAVVPFGYFDGYPRSYSNKGFVLIDGRRCKVVGRVCMNAFMVDVSGIRCRVDDEVVLIGCQEHDKVYADELARLDDSIPHELLSRLSPSLHREYRFR